jgi:hypothetical protein
MLKIKNIVYMDRVLDAVSSHEMLARCNKISGSKFYDCKVPNFKEGKMLHLKVDEEHFEQMISIIKPIIHDDNKFVLFSLKKAPNIKE